MYRLARLTASRSQYGASSPLKAVTKYTPPVSLTEPTSISISELSSMIFIWSRSLYISQDLAWRGDLPLDGRSSDCNRPLQSVDWLGVRSSLESDSTDQTILASHKFLPSIEQNEGSSTISILGFTPRQTLVTNQSSLLITTDSRDGDSSEGCFDICVDFPVDFGRRDNFG